VRALRVKWATYVDIAADLHVSTVRGADGAFQVMADDDLPRISPGVHCWPRGYGNVQYCSAFVCGVCCAQPDVRVMHPVAHATCSGA
jgi:hypothetical protein